MKVLLLGLLSLSSYCFAQTATVPATGVPGSIVAGPLEVDVDDERLGKVIYGYGRLGTDLTLLVSGLTGVDAPKGAKRDEEVAWAASMTEQFIAEKRVSAGQDARFKGLLAGMQKLERASRDLQGASNAELDSMLEELVSVRTQMRQLAVEFGSAP
ncbi:hypothetical protein HHL21_07900 [Massilia sp. RP-1-19]|uniref:Uncharacterized protein n=1 Tax=Massilia polaris TaxID=2728846 RepID=A0A848HP11_9BURK|nr:hypothetical protein [Massilia polaris]NML61003.1 hypothetical protein [Massilia polaris]